MQNRPSPCPDYEWLASTFNPTKFDAHAWVTLAKAAGMKYITITSRHHDGFAMFATRATRYNIVDWTPFQRDPLKELADECAVRHQDLLLLLTARLASPRLLARGSTGHRTGRPRTAIGAITSIFSMPSSPSCSRITERRRHWFDGMWDKPDATGACPDLRADSPVAAGRADRAQSSPDARPGEDVQTFEQDLPGANTAASIRRRSGDCRSRRRCE